MSHSVDYCSKLGVAAVAMLAFSGNGFGAVADSAKPGAAAAQPNYAEIYEKNVFDPNRQPWADAPPAAAVSPINPGDIEIYGVMSVGGYKKAIIKPGPAFKGAPAPVAGGRPFIMLAVGQTLGAYTLVEISEKNIVFESGGARYPVAFSRKLDRPAPVPAAPPMQAAVVLPVPVPTLVAGIAPIAVEPIASATPPTPQPEAAPAQASPTQPGQQQVAAAAPAAAAQPAPETTAPSPPIQGRTLLEAIQAAQEAAQRGEKVPTYANPFTKQ